MSVRPTTAKALQDAMARLLEGRPSRSDGKLTWTNVAIEAGVPRATAARAADLIAEWQNALLRRHETGAPPVPAEETRALRAAMEEKAREAAETHKALRGTIRTMANHIQALSLALEQKDAIIAGLGSQGRKVVPLKGSKG